MSFEIRPEDDLIEGVWPTFETLLVNHGENLTNHIAQWMDSDSFDQCMRDMIRDNDDDNKYLNLDEIDEDNEQDPSWKTSAWDVFEEYLSISPESVAEHFARWLSNEDLAQCMVDFIKDMDLEQDYLKSASEDESFTLYVQYANEQKASYYDEYATLEDAREDAISDPDFIHYQIYNQNDELVEEDTPDLDYEGITKEYNVDLNKIYQKTQSEIEDILGCEEGELDRFNYANEQEEKSSSKSRK